MFLPPSLPFASSFWSYKQQAKTNKQQGKFSFLISFLI
jgi:hypothetical protein